MSLGSIPRTGDAPRRLCVFVPGVEQRGAGASGADEVDGQVSPAVVGQGEPGLDVLQGGHVTVRAEAGVHAFID